MRIEGVGGHGFLIVVPPAIVPSLKDLGSVELELEVQVEHVPWSLEVWLDLELGVKAARLRGCEAVR
jgi:hypothetical protein